MIKTNKQKNKRISSLNIKKVWLSFCFALIVLCGILGFSLGSDNSANIVYAATSTAPMCLTNGSYVTKSSPTYVRKGCPKSFYSIYMYSTYQDNTESTIDNDTVLNWSYYYIKVVPSRLDKHISFELKKDGATYMSSTPSGNSETVLYQGALSSGSYEFTYSGSYGANQVFGSSATYIYTYRFVVDVSAPTYTLKAGSTSISSGSYVNQQITYSVSDSHTGNLYYRSPSNSSYYSTTNTSYTVSATSGNNGWWYFYSTDSYGNTNSTVSAYLDTVKPVGMVTANGSTVSNGGYTNKSFYYTATDSGSGISS